MKGNPEPDKSLNMGRRQKRSKRVACILLSLLLSLPGAPLSLQAKGSEQDFPGVYHTLQETPCLLRIEETMEKTMEDEKEGTMETEKEEQFFLITLYLPGQSLLFFKAREENNALRASTLQEEPLQMEAEWVEEEGGSLAVCLTDPSQESLKTDKELSFVPGPPCLAPQVLCELLRKTCRGYEGSAGASLKEAIAAQTLLETAIGYAFSLQDQQTLAEGLRFSKEESLEPGMEETLERILGIASKALDDFSSLEGLFEDAGIREEMEKLVSSPHAREDLEAFQNAWDLVRAGEAK